MGNIDLELIKKVREMTQAGIVDVKKALEETNGNIDAAIQWLREKGIARAAKKGDAIATEGIANVVIKDNMAVIYELNCQTDFVTSNENFINLVDEIGLTLIDGGTNDYAKATTVLKTSNDITIAQECINLTAKIGEKISLRRFEIVTKKNDEMFAHYQHSNKKIAVLLIINKRIDIVVAKDIAMHAAAMAPIFVNTNQVDKDWLANETKILKEQAIAEGKPVDKAEMIVKGRINKRLGEVVLEFQPFVKNPKVSVKDHLASNNGSLLHYVRYEVGEGIEKKVVDFAAEVESQMRK